ncbi:MAG: hypothetical protein XXXJIFNMEKO3_01690 [Candidatus Erwinia impunctatus]|nr:hypothetical protein XXXJIFNMEKO_01690 [Culicoides impunctatus]
MNISQRLTLICSLLTASLIATVVVSLIVISGFQSRFQYVQANAIPSIIDLGELVNGSNKLIIWMYRHQTAINDQRQAEVEKEIDNQLGALFTLNGYYLKNDISSEEDLRMTQAASLTLQELKNRFPIFLQASRARDNSISLNALQSSDGVGQAARDLIAGYQKQLKLM